jgi:predicted amidohydrolase YtcJ
MRRRTSRVHVGGRAAAVPREEHRLHEAGKNADIAVWDQNPYAIATQEIQHLHCVLTLFEGTVVYEAN